MNQSFADLLPQVTRPIRYTDSELYAVRNKKDARVKFALVFADIYELGMSNYGLRVLYHVLNRIPEVRAERAFMPWADMVEKMRENRILLSSLESGTPLSEFDAVGITLQSELSFTNVLAVLELAGIPLHAQDRKSGDPVVIGGGPCAVNPLPLKPFFDAFLIGDGEEAVVEMAELMLETQNPMKRLEALAGVEGVWVPAIHGKHKTVRRRMVRELRPEDVPTEQIVPIGQIEHDRLVVEIGRGCARGCRFCQAGFCNRPTRFRPQEEIIKLASQGIALTGWEEASLLSFAVSDYPRLQELLEGLDEALSGSRTAISLPSFRGEAFTEELGRTLKRIKKTGLTFAPETASVRLKKVIGKNVSNQSVANTVKTAASLGWQRVKLYFMIGLPTEAPEDIDAIIDFVHRLGATTKGITINLHIASFVPKPHTPLQWVPFADLAWLRGNLARIRDEAGGRKVRIKWAKPEASFIEAVLARGDERVAGVLEGVLQRGGYFQEWSEHFDLKRWLEVFEDKGINPEQYTRERDQVENLPWGFIDIGVPRQFLKREYQKAASAQAHSSISEEPLSLIPKPGDEKNHLAGDGEKKSEKIKNTGAEFYYRVKFSVGEEFRYASHLDTVRAIYRMLRRSRLRLAYTKGFSPHPRVRFGFPKPVGVTSLGEYFDVVLGRKTSDDVAVILKEYAPPGLVPLEARLLAPGAPSLTKSAQVLRFQVEPSPRTETSAPLAGGDHNQGIIRAASSDGKLDLVVGDAGRFKLWEVLAQLYNLTPQKARTLEVTRIDAYIKRGQRLLTPFEEILDG